MRNMEYGRIKRRMAITILIYAAFILYLTYTPEHSIVTTIVAMAMMYGFAFIILLGFSLVVIFASSLTALLFRLWGDRDTADKIVDSVYKATGLIPTFIVLALIVIPCYIILNNPYRFPVLHGMLSWLFKLK